MKKDSPGLPELWPTIALLGCGAMAEKFYLPALSHYPSVFRELILVDNDYQKARRVAEQFQVKRYQTHYGEIINSVDGVIIALPHHLHYPIAKAFLNKRVHVLCEKPLAETGAEAREMVRIAAENGVTLSLNNTRRLFPSSGIVKQLIADGEIGKVLSIRYYEGGEFAWPTASGFYFNSKLSQKGVLLDIGAHVFDVICWWLGEKPRVVSCEYDSFGGCESVASVLFECKDCKGEIRLSRLSKLPNHFCIKGDRGVIEGGVYDKRSVTVSTAAAHGRQKKIQARQADSFDIVDNLVANFLDVLACKAQPLVPASAVVASIELLDEAYNKATRFHMPWYNLEGVVA
jgi:predicted dehydrogenase